MSGVLRGTSILVALAGAATSGAAHTGTLATRVRICNELASGLNTVVIGATAETSVTVNGNTEVNREAGLTYSFKMHPGETVTIEKQVGQTITPTGAISYTPVVYR
jgi:hypothetical protein